MNPKNTHPDLLALAEGRLNSDERRTALSHLAGCPQCRLDYQELSQCLGIIERVARQARAAFSLPGELKLEADRLLVDSAGESRFSLAAGEITYTLPVALQRRLDPRPGLAERLSHAAQTLGGLGKEAAQALGERIVQGGAQPMGAPAVRKDATKVDDDEPAHEDQPKK